MTLFDIRDLSVRRGAALLLEGFSGQFRAGEFVGVVGPNGAGKSTLLRALAGLERETGGAVELGGSPISAQAPAARARLLSYLPQARDIHWAITAEAVVSLGRFAYGGARRLGPVDRAAVERALAVTDMASFRSRVASTLSGGEQARLHLARALAAETPVLIADEPTAALDTRHALAVLGVLQARAQAGGLVLAALHDLDFARRFCTRIVILNEGALVADAKPEDALGAETLAAVFGIARTDAGWNRLDDTAPSAPAQ